MYSRNQGIGVDRRLSPRGHDDLPDAEARHRRPGRPPAPLREDAGVLEAVIVTVILSTGGHSN